MCLYLERFGAYPRRYAREIYNNESIVMGHRKANKLINSCSLCRLCEVVCPEDFSMAHLCREGRRSMVDRAKMPPSAHEFALQDMLFSTGEHFALCRHQPGRAESAHLFFPGCQLCESSPEQVERIYDYLCDRQAGHVPLRQPGAGNLHRGDEDPGGSWLRCSPGLKTWVRPGRKDR